MNDALGRNRDYIKCFLDTLDYSSLVLVPRQKVEVICIGLSRAQSHIKLQADCEQNDYAFLFYVQYLTELSISMIL